MIIVTTYGAEIAKLAKRVGPDFSIPEGPFSTEALFYTKVRLTYPNDDVDEGSSPYSPGVK